MRRVLRVNPKTHLVCVPQEMVEDGMVGDVNAYPNAVTLTLVTPGANLEDIEASLERTLDDIRHRIRFTTRDAPNRKEARKSLSLKPSFDELRKRLKGGG